MRCKACTWPPAERSVLTRPATLLSMSMSWLFSVSCGNVLIAGVKVSWLRPLHVKPLRFKKLHPVCQHWDTSCSVQGVLTTRFSDLS